MKTPINEQELREAAEKATPGLARYLANFFQKIRVEGECWIWTAARSGKPGRQYGCFWNGTPIKAHQFAHLVWKGAISDGLFVLHTCDRHLCVNPAHLYVGTHAQNVRDAVERKRFRNGCAEKTHCPQGHPYAGENLYEYRGQRQCKTCRDTHRGRTPQVYF